MGCPVEDKSSSFSRWYSLIEAILLPNEFPVHIYVEI